MQDSLDQIFTLYREAFPATERRDESDLRQALATPAYRLLTKHEQDQLLGFAIIFVPPASDFALLEYLAIGPNWRGKGHGADLLLRAIRRSRGRTVLSEIERASNGPAAHRRQQFYFRGGFRPLDGMRYHLPLAGNPPPMELWVRRPSSAPTQPAQLANWLTTIYTEVYHCPSDDPRIEEMLGMFKGSS